MDHPYWNYSEIEPTQVAKDVRARQEVPIDVFECFASFFRRLKAYAEVPMTEAIKHIMVMKMAEVLGLIATATKELKQSPASELTPDTMLPIADRDSEKYLKKLLGRTDIEDAMSRLNGLTQEEQMVFAQVLKVAHNVKDGVEIVGDQVKGDTGQVKEVGDLAIDVDDKVKVVGDLAIEGTSGQTYHLILFLCILFSFFFLSSIIVRPGAYFM